MQQVKRLLAISDPHGQIDLFCQLLEKISFEPEQDLLFLLGDYVDRGENPQACVKKARQLEQMGAIVLKGNHEEMMEKALTKQKPEDIEHWAANGGSATLRSYDLSIKALYQAALCGQPFDLPEQLTNDLEWIQTLNLYAQTEHYLFVHAGINPDRPLDDQDEQDLLWIREPFFNGYKGSRTVVFGHTPTLNLHSSYDVYFGNNAIIGIDGGAVFGGQLNALELPSKMTWSVP